MNNFNQKIKKNNNKIKISRSEERCFPARCLCGGEEEEKVFFIKNEVTFILCAHEIFNNYVVRPPPIFGTKKVDHTTGTSFSSLEKYGLCAIVVLIYDWHIMYKNKER